jgi:hypothetical protein
MSEVNEMGQQSDRHAHEERMENYKIQMLSYTEEAARKLDRDCGTATAESSYPYYHLHRFSAELSQKETEPSTKV